jgi:uncharacterized repeat protein (TIGR01451 family)
MAGVSITPQPPLIDLALTKLANNVNPTPNEDVTFTITVSNGGSAVAATGIQVTDSVPSDMTYRSHTATQGTYNAGTGVWTVGALASGDSAQLSLQARVNLSVVGATIANTAYITAMTGSDPNIANNSGSVTLVVRAEPGIGTPNGVYITLYCGDSTTVDITSKPVSTHAGYDFIYYENPSPSPGYVQMNSVIVELGTTSTGPWHRVFYWGDGVLDANSSLGAAGYGAGSEPNAQLIPMTDPPLYGSPLTTGVAIDVDAVAPPGTYTWVRLTVPSSNCSDSEIDSIDSLPIPNANLGITKLVNNPAPYENETITYTIGVTNFGPARATNVQVTDLLPGGLTYVSHAVTGGSYNAGSGVWTIGTLYGGVGVQLQITATVNIGTGGTTITNSASITALNETDPNPANNTANAPVVVSPSADLSLTSMCSNNPPVYRSWRVRNANHYPITFDWQIVGHGLSGQQTAPAAVGATPGEVFFDTPFTGNPNTMTISVAGVQHDVSASNPAACVNVDLAVSKGVDNPTPAEGATILYTVTALNSGPDPATSVQVNDVLPGGVVLTGAGATQGTYAGGTGVWAIGSLAGGASATLTLTATVNVGTAGMTITNTATITGAEYDPNAGNNSASVNLVPVSGLADLGISLSVSPATVSPTLPTTYTISLTNYGPTTSTGVLVKDQLPVALDYASSIPGQGTYDPLTGDWNVGSLTSGATVTLQILASAKVGTENTTITNVTSIAGSAPSDPNPGNNNSSADLTVVP